MKRGAFASAIRVAVLILRGGRPVCVCSACQRDDDDVIGKAGDFSLCERCKASITSKTGVTVIAARIGH
jgi:hypothetical protein